MLKQTTYYIWKTLCEKESKMQNPPQRFFCVRRGAGNWIAEIYIVYDLRNHIKERIYTLKEVVKIMEKERELRKDESIDSV